MSEDYSLLPGFLPMELEDHCGKVKVDHFVREDMPCGFF
jgi:hypothetical protein